MTTREEIDKADHAGADIFFMALTGFFDLEWRRTLDAFARDGILTVKRYRDKVAKLDAWELNPEHKDALMAFSPDTVRIGCSYEGLTEAAARGEKWSFIIVDTPQGLYPTGEGTVVAEHFTWMGRLPDIMADDCVVAFYVNKRPYSREDTENFGRDEYAESYNFDKWMQLRAQFYGVADGRIITDEQAISAYSRLFESRGYAVKHLLVTPCYDFAPGLPPSFRCAMQLVKINNPMKSRIADQ